jgi:hypothetical protein
VSNARARGTAFETAVVRFLQDGGLWAARKALTVPDSGDINVGPDVVTLQLKAYKNLADGLREGVEGATIQARVAGTQWSAAVLKRPRKGVPEAYVSMTLTQFREILWLLVQHDKENDG